MNASDLDSTAKTRVYYGNVYMVYNVLFCLLFHYLCCLLCVQQKQD